VDGLANTNGSGSQAALHQRRPRSCVGASARRGRGAGSGSTGACPGGVQERPRRVGEILEYTLATVAILVVAAALFGWGRCFQQLSGLPAQRWPVAIGIGLGTVIFLGGLCNLLGAARPFAFNAMIAFGLVLAALPLRSRSRLLPARLPRANEAWPALPLFTVLIGIGAFVIATTLTLATFNHHDDFEKYFPQVVRMLATGTLHDNPIGSIGIETLGGQAVLQGFILADFPLDYINGADAVFCLLLCVLITGSVAFARPFLLPAAFGGIIALIAIDPRYVNIAGIYSLAALSLTLLFVGYDARAEPEGVPSGQRLEPAVGLFYAAQIAVKLTAISFVGLHFVGWIAATAWLCGGWRLALRRGVKTALWSVAFLTPWGALWAPDYIAVLAPPPGSPVLPQSPPAAPIFFNPFATDPYFSPAWYSAAAAIVCAAGGAALIRARRLTSRDSARSQVAAFAAFCIAAAANYVFCFVYVGPYLAGVEAAARYAAPWLIAGMAAALSLGPIFWQPVLQRADGSFAKAPAISLAIGLIVVAMFSTSLMQRIGPPGSDGMPQDYLRSLSPQARAGQARAIDQILHGNLRAAVRNAQSRVPAGTPMLAWMVEPFLLDFERNPIREIGWYQLVRPWSLIPQTDYVLWQYGGFAVRQPRDYAEQLQGDSPILARASVGALRFGDLLQQIGRRSDVLYNDNGIVVLHVACARGLALC
jgi:hypothetical protein